MMDIYMYLNRISFDTVWEETLKKAQKNEK